VRRRADSRRESGANFLSRFRGGVVIFWRRSAVAGDARFMIA
jgi:hypothetical protein